MDPLDHLLSSYNFTLPEQSIAQRPLDPRHAAKMLVVPRNGVQSNNASPSSLRHQQVWHLVDELDPGDLLVVNDTRVLRARLKARRASGGLVELLVLEPRGNGLWLCLARPAKRLRPGEDLQVLSKAAQPLVVRVESRDQATGGLLVRFPPTCVDGASIEDLLVRYGEVPLPPYIHRHDPQDAERYQTRYALTPGAVAAPTAGLHLSDELLAALKRKGVVIMPITLHVGLGTFRPLEAENLSGLQLHSEWVEVRPELVAAVRDCQSRGGRVVAVGTTSVRSLEGVAHLHNGQLVPFRGPINLVIQPGFEFAVVEGLLTNFHLPRSSLLLLVSALLGRRRLMEVYAEAIKTGYRFYSYGDAMWIPPIPRT